MNINKNVAFDFTVNMGVAGVALSVYQSVNGGAYSAAVTDIDTDNSDGTYKLAFSQAFTNYNFFSIKVTGSGVVTQYLDFICQPAVVASVTAVSAGAITESSFANDAISDAKVKSDVTIASVTGAVGSVGSAVTVTGTVNANLIQILGTAITETVGGYIAAAFKKLFDVVTPLLTASSAMRGTDGAITSLTGVAQETTLTTLHGHIDDIVADTNEIQGELVDGGRLDLLIDSILADTNEIQTELVDGGRLDLLIDSIITHLVGIKGGSWSIETLKAIYNKTSGLTSQQTRDAMLLAPTAPGTPIADSIDDKIESISGGTGLNAQETRNALALDLGVGVTPAEGSIDKELTDIASAIGAGSGKTTKEYTVVDGDGAGIPNVYVKATSVSNGTGFVVDGYTNSFGKVTFELDTGTYYFWRELAGYDFSNPDTEVVS